MQPIAGETTENVFYGIGCNGHGLAQTPCVATYFGDWGAFFETASVWPIEGGIKRLIDAIVAESNADLRLCTLAAAIEDDGSGVTVTTRDGERIRARHGSRAPDQRRQVEYRHDGDTLVMCLCSDAAAIRADDRDAVQTALRTFVPDIEVIETASHDWATDQFSQRTFAMHRPGNLEPAPRGTSLPRLRVAAALSIPTSRHLRLIEFCG